MSQTSLPSQKKWWKKTTILLPDVVLGHACLGIQVDREIIILGDADQDLVRNIKI